MTGGGEASKQGAYHRRGRCTQPHSALDMIIAAIAEANDCVVATGNERHFRGITNFVNPLMP